MDCKLICDRPSCRLYLLKKMLIYGKHLFQGIQEIDFWILDSVKKVPDGDEMENKINIKPIIESLLFVHEKPLTVEKIEEIIPDLTKDEIAATIVELMEEYNRAEHKGIQVIEIANGFQMCTKKHYEQYIKKLLAHSKNKKISKPALETLSIIAYKQPVTKAEIEALRGVESSGAIRSLLESRLIKIEGRKKVPGRPILYATTENFLVYFGLKNLNELPPLHEINQIMEEK
jgi:segregation and condensation protein B